MHFVRRTPGGKVQISRTLLARGRQSKVLQEWPPPLGEAQKNRGGGCRLISKEHSCSKAGNAALGVGLWATAREWPGLEPPSTHYGSRYPGNSMGLTSRCDDSLLPGLRVVMARATLPPVPAESERPLLCLQFRCFKMLRNGSFPLSGHPGSEPQSRGCGEGTEVMRAEPGHQPCQPPHPRRPRATARELG